MMADLVMCIAICAAVPDGELDGSLSSKRCHQNCEGVPVRLLNLLRAASADLIENR